MPLRRVGILTGGGDCSGLNAVIRGITRAAIIQHNATVIGIEDGFEGLIFDRRCELDIKSTREILPLGGTILGTSNKGNPFEYREYDDKGQIVVHDYSERSVKNFKKMMLDCLFVVGGEGTLMISHEFFKRGLPVIGVPKTIDNDLEGTDYTFGFQTAVQVACDALDRLQTTGKSHERVMILEVMGRHAGWIALESGIAGGAHIILIPEIPYNLDLVMDKIKLRAAGGSPFSIIVVAEGAKPVGGGEVITHEADKTLQGVVRLGGVGNAIASQIACHIDLEVRCTVLGHIQRGGTPNAFDRVLGTRLGSYAVQAAAEGKFGHMVSLNTPDITLAPMENLAGKVRLVPPTSQLVQCAEAIGICMGR
ncbi:MAG: ATP-dependent 6-phosphofructokinase [Nitrospinae bacterium]|nr:ATP-dependent 6-phosphofructokinase [Nitrospinota bacterium]